LRLFSQDEDNLIAESLDMKALLGPIHYEDDQDYLARLLAQGFGLGEAGGAFGTFRRSSLLMFDDEVSSRSSA
jgi:hypothetical protein